jgi:Integrase core domain
METTSAAVEAPRPLIAPNPPVRRIADVVRAVVKTMELAGFGGSDLIARTLARAGWKLSSRTVGRIRRGRWPMLPLPEPASGRPAHFISDHARCFTGKVFRRKLLRLRVKQRFGAIGKKGSIALIERLWRTLKDTLGLRLLRPSTAVDLAATVELGLLHYAHFRPHQGIGGATPAEVYFGRTPSHLSAIPPPRGRPGEGPMDFPFCIDYLDAERLLPVLVRQAA